ncbi:MAG TPA: flavin reductase family protein [Acidobacteriota bacterium]|nr:flavin reductase family protein [Acidobacteriota bacterium]
MKQSLGATTLVFPTPVWVIGTYNKDGKPNVMTAAWGGVCCSKPPCVTVSLREATYSFGNLMARKAFTVSIPSETYIKEADYIGIASGRDEDKFATTGLTPVKSELVDAPYVAEFPWILECRIIHTHEIGLHTQFIGEIMDVKIEEGMLKGKGVPDVEKVKACLFAPGIRKYYGVGKYLGDGYSLGHRLMKTE